MNKFLARIKSGYIHTITYRSEVFLWLFLDTFPVLITILVWVSIYADKSMIGSYSLSNIISYFTLVLIINSITASHFEHYRVEQIRMGKIDYFLTRPFSYIHEILFGHIAGKLFYFTVSLPFFFIIIKTIQSILAIELPTFTFSSFLLFIGLISFAMVVEFLIGLIVVLLGFWFEGSDGLEHFKWITISLFSGSLIPIEMMPQWLKHITELLPFKYMYAVPIETALYQKFITYPDIIIMCSCIAVLVFSASLLWKYAKLQYTSAGG